MIYDLAMIAQLAQRCAPEVATEAVVPLVVTESAGNTLQINVNKGPRVQAASVAQAAALVRRYMAAGYTVDVGLAQVNSGNFARLGVSVEQAFEPCTNLHLASQVLQEGYALASRSYAGLDAISATYSLYNSGSMTRGLRNGYVRRVWANAAVTGAVAAAPSLPVTPPSGSKANLPDAQAADSPRWVVGQIDASVEVFK
ncbi:lytic transglycosylase domain-containing protein [Novosphingobium rosa]|uniref:lytic transglycosylase domain-containing protein n=1 Tax=Novosphingobium rosa TaxID=76978 RepID=UPI000833294D|nr:lytic transglycosylase domain-containing protein [Novosphingobium rosa]